MVLGRPAYRFPLLDFFEADLQAQPSSCRVVLKGLLTIVYAVGGICEHAGRLYDAGLGMAESPPVSPEQQKLFVVRFKPKGMKPQFFAATSAAIHGEHLVLLNPHLRAGLSPYSFLTSSGAGMRLRQARRPELYHLMGKHGSRTAIWEVLGRLRRWSCGARVAARLPC
jgi:hypothetical protein